MQFVSFPARARGGAVLLAMLALGVGGGCSRQEAPARKTERPPVPVLATQSVAATFPIELRAVGNVESIASVTVRARVGGEVTKVHFTEGQDVKEGELLFSIDPRPFETALRMAEANLAREEAQSDNLRIEFNRQKQLFGSALISRDEFEKAEAALKAQEAAAESTRAAVRTARLNLGFTEIRAPMAGRAGDVHLHPGNLVQANGDVMVLLNQLRPIYVSFAVPEHHLADIRQRMSGVRLQTSATIRGWKGAQPEGELTFVDNAVDPTTGTIQIKATFPNDTGALWPGQFVEVVLRLDELTNAVVVPAQAVQRGQTNEFVFVVRPDQSVELRPVTPGPSRRGETVIERGLAAGETVVTDGQLRLSPGAKVNIKPGLVPESATLSPVQKP